MGADDAVAIVGMACRFPGAPDVARFWANLRDGVDTLSFFSHEQLVASGVDPDLARHPDYVLARGVLADAERFDWAFFGYSQAEAASIDPQQRVFLECASAALDDAGIDPQRFEGGIGVFAGCDAAHPVLDDDLDPAQELIGQEKDFLATRAAYKLGLRGPAVTVQTACSTSMVAVHYGCQALLGYECDAVIAGGVSVWLPQTVGYLYREGNILSRDGHCRPFDAHASGTVPSSGVGAVILRRLNDALQAGDRVVAVIRGSAVNNDGGEKIGFTAPSVSGQRDVIRSAMAQAGIDADDISYVEAHGTGTRIGDPVEVAALSAAFREQTDRVGYCWLGAAKSNIGHTGAAAGVAGLIKTACMLERRELVPTAHFEGPNPELQLETSPFQICARQMPWLSAGPLVASVSSFGIGGTNAHAVLESAPALVRDEERSVPRVFCLSAATPEALTRLRIGLAERLEADDSPSAVDVAWTLATGRRRLAHRVSLIADGEGSAAAELRRDASAVRAETAPQVALLFPGQGTLHAGDARAAYELLPEFRAVFDRSAALLRERFGVDLGALLLPETDPGWLRDTERQQLGLFVVGFALASQLREWGVTPAAMLGHSVGEYVAAAIAGVWSLPDALGVVRARGRAMWETLPGRMLAVAAPANEMAALILDDGTLAVAVDAPGQVVIAGPTATVEALHARLRARQVPCRLLDAERAFHSPLMRPAAAVLRQALAATPNRLPELPFVSNLTGDWADGERVLDPEYWVAHLCEPVRLRACIETLLAGPCQVFVELGPGETMTRALRRHERWDGGRLAVPTLGGPSEVERDRLLRSLGRLWERGIDIRWEDLYSKEHPRRCALPPHPFEPRSCQRQRRSRERPTSVNAARASALTCRRWREAFGAEEGAYDALLIVGNRPSGKLARLLAGLCVPGGRTWLRPDEALLAPPVLPALEELAGAALPAIAVVLPEELKAGALEELDALAKRADAAGAQLVMIGRGLVDVLGTEQRGATALAAWVEHRRRAAPGRKPCLIDIGPGQDPAWPPATGADGGTFAWRGRRWWALASESVQQTAEAPPRRVAVVSWGRPEGPRLAAELAARGVRVGAFAAADTVSVDAVSPREIARGLHWRPDQTRLSRRPDLVARLDRYAGALIARFVLRQADLAPSATVPEDLLRRRLDPIARLPRLAAFFVATLVAERFIVSRSDGLTVLSDAEARIESGLRERDALGEVAGICRLLERCADAYQAVFAGAREPLAVLYPHGDEAVLRAHLLENQVVVGDAEPCLDALCQAMRELKARIGDRPLRILEVGAGHGLFAWRLLDGWEERRGVEYYFTDVSSLLVQQARERCRASGLDGVRCSAFDLTRDPVQQGLANGTFDAVVGYNVVHVAPSIIDALRRLDGLLRPGGWLCLVELTRVARWQHMVWGLAPGWWAFADDLRRDSTHVDAATWLRVLGEVGLTDIAAVPMDFDADHVLLLGARTPVGAQSPVERVAEEVRRQATQGGYEALLYLPRLDGQTDAAEAVRLWSELCSHPTARGLRQAFAVTEDPGAESGWRAERLRRGMDPVEGEPPETGWRHVEVPQLGAAELAALSRLLAQRGLPAVVRLELAGAVAEGASTSEAAAGSEPAAPARRDELEPGAAAPALDPLRQALADLWCDVLGVPVVAEADDFFESGGESLMAIFFLGRVRDRLNIAIEVTAFMASPTFGHLLALAQEPHADLGAAPAQGSPVRNLVVFRGGGSRRPLFLTAPAAGSSLCYRDLAALLDDRQPCYGIDCPGVFDGGMPLTRLEDLAAHHIEVIRHVRPHGPYLLGGWSVGAMVAHEMVRQLAQQGEVVDLLVCIDGYVPDTGGRPLATSPRHLVVGLARLLQPGPRLRMAGGLGRTAELSGGNTGMPDLARVYRASVLAMLRYVPGRVPSRAVVFKTGLDADRRAHLGRRLAPLYEGGVEVRPAPGSHWTVLDPGHIVELARELRDVLVRLEPEG